MMTNRCGPAVAAVLPILLASSAGAHAQTPESQQELRGSIRIVGTDTMKQLMDRWIAGFTAIHAEVRIALAAKGALTAAPALSDGSADLATLGREFTSEIAGFRAKRPYDPTGIRVAIGSYDTSGKTVALAFFVNQANPITRLNFQQLEAIYCNSLLRKAPHPITKWGQLGLTGEWASRDIHPVGVNFPDGISNFIRLGVCKGGDLRQGIREEHTGGSINVLDRIVTDVAADSAFIGYAGFANLKPGSKLIAISEDGGSYLEGKRAEVETARYPLSRYIYIFIDRAPGQPLPPLEREFLRYVTSPAGQALVGLDNIYVPLPLPIAASQQEELR
jgi:phosphate transport system substrate-binding protein